MSTKENALYFFSADCEFSEYQEHWVIPLLVMWYQYWILYEANQFSEYPVFIYI